MGVYLGLDVGTTSISGVILDTGRRKLTAIASIVNDSQVDASVPGRSEWDIDYMADLSLRLAAELVEQHGGRVDALGVTGQQHGMVLLDAEAAGRGELCVRSRFIGWQDRRCDETAPGGTTWVEQMLNQGGAGFLHSGCRPATGHMGATLFWLAEQGELPSQTVACFAPDYLVARMVGGPPVTDPTLAASAGVYDVLAGEWNWDLASALRIASYLPPVVPSCTVAGVLSPGVARATGLPEGLPLTVPCGDNQASFAGSVAEPLASVLLNIGTGGQLSVYVAEVPSAVRDDPGLFLCGGLDLRPFLGAGYLLVGTAGCGGRSYRALRDFLQRVGEQVFGLTVEDELYDRMDELAAAVPPGADGITCEPVFGGSRRDPTRRAVWRGISEASFTPGHLARSLLEGVVREYRMLYEEMMALGVTARGRLIGAGNGIRKNALWRQIAEEAFGLCMELAWRPEEAALGAALAAAVALGEYASIHEASAHCVVYSGEA